MSSKQRAFHSVRVFLMTKQYEKNFRLFSTKIRSVDYGIKLFTLPPLSPTMKQAVISKWHIQSGDLIPNYGLVLEVKTTSLTQVSFTSSEITNDVSTMEIEIVEGDMYLAKIFVQEGQLVDIGKPLALFCEKKEDIPHLSTLEIINLSNYSYDSPIWQAYVKSKSDPGATVGCS